MRNPPAGVVRKDERDKQSESNSDGTFNDEKLRKMSQRLPQGRVKSKPIAILGSRESPPFRPTHQQQSIRPSLGLTCYQRSTYLDVSPRNEVRSF